MTEKEKIPHEILGKLESYLSDLDERIRLESEAEDFIRSSLPEGEEKRKAIEPVARMIIAYNNAKKELIKYFPELKE